MLFTAKCFWPGATESEIRLAVTRAASGNQQTEAVLRRGLVPPPRRSRPLPVRLGFARGREAGERAGQAVRASDRDRLGRAGRPEGRTMFKGRLITFAASSALIAGFALPALAASPRQLPRLAARTPKHDAYGLDVRRAAGVYDLSPPPLKAGTAYTAGFFPLALRVTPPDGSWLGGQGQAFASRTPIACLRLDRLPVVACGSAARRHLRGHLLRPHSVGGGDGCRAPKPRCRCHLPGGNIGQARRLLRHSVRWHGGRTEPYLRPVQRSGPHREVSSPMPSSSTRVRCSGSSC